MEDVIKQTEIPYEKIEEGFKLENDIYIINIKHKDKYKDSIYYINDIYSDYRVDLIKYLINNKKKNIIIDEDKYYCKLKLSLKETKTAGCSFAKLSEFKEGKALGYIRVSTVEQTELGESLDNQESKIYKYADEKNLKLRKIFTDEGKSAFVSTKNKNNLDVKMTRMLDKRCGLNDMIEEAKKGDYLIFHSISRFMRNLTLFVIILDKIKNKEAHLVFLDYPTLNIYDPQSSLLITVMATLAQMESEITSKRTIEVMKHLKDNGKLKLKLPYGYKYEEDKKIEIPDELRKINVIRSIIAEHGNPSYGIILRDLKNRQVSPLRNAKKWHPNTIKRIIEREEYDIKIKGKKKELNGEGKIIEVDEGTKFAYNVKV